jgi:L-fuculose-phosphate aldolase
MQVNLTTIKKQMCDIGQRIWQRGYCAGNEGNHSVRLGPDRFLCTPSGISKGFLKPDDLLVVDGEGAGVFFSSKGRQPTSEIKVHLAIYHNRPDVNAVIHSHPPHATAFAICDQPLPLGIHPEAELFLGNVPTAPYATPSTQAAADAVASVISPDTNTVLMANHGSVSFSTTLLDAYYKLEILDAYCRLLILARQAGQISPLSNQQRQELHNLKADFANPTTFR